jgi:hypothetical protein
LISFSTLRGTREEGCTPGVSLGLWMIVSRTQADS